MNKRGQFYLLAAIIIIVLIIGFVGVSNYLNKKDSTRIYDIKEELNIEGKDVLEFGILNSKDTSLFDESGKKTAEGEDAIIKHFISLYTTYLESVGENMNIYYILGNGVDIKAYKIVDLETGSLSLNLGGTTLLTPIIKKSIQDIGGISTTESEVIVTINEVPYDFELKEGENFYFIISQNVGGEKYVATS